MLGDAAEDAYEELPHGTSMGVNMVAGALAGIAEHTITFPFDSIKTRMQLLNPHPQAIYTGVTHAIGKIVSGEGMARLWRGVVSVVIGAGPAHAIYFGGYEHAKKILKINDADAGASPFRTSLAGATATVLSDAVMTPFDVIKQRMQVHGSLHRNVFDCAKTLWRTEGPMAFYLSYPTTLILNVPFQCVQFPVYEGVRALMNPTRQYDPLSHIVSGGIAGATAAAITTPIDVIKTALQTRGLMDSEQRVKLGGALQVARYILAKDGPRGLWRGVQPRLLTHIPATAVCWTMYEYFKWILA